MKALLSLLALLMVFGCSTASVRVMPGADGLHRVDVRDIERDDAEEEAIKAANNYCEKKTKEAVFVKTDKTKYMGEMDEKTRNTVRKGSRVAMVVGSVGVIPEASRVAGGILGTAGLAGTMMTSDRDYQTSVTFRCQ